MKKQMILASLACSLILGGCSAYQEETDTDPTAQSDSPAAEENLETSQTFTQMPHPVLQGTLTEGRTLSLVDLTTGENLAAHHFEGPHLPTEAFELENGYIGVLTRIFEPFFFMDPEELLSDREGDAHRSEHDADTRLMIFDPQLNLIENHPIASENFEVFASWLRPVLQQDDDGIAFLFTPNYLFLDTIGQPVYRYDVTTGTETRLLDTAHRFNINTLEPLDDQTIAFIGGRVSGDGRLLYLGTLDLEAGQMNYLNETDFREGRLMAAGSQLLISEGLHWRELDEHNRPIFEGAHQEIILANLEHMTHERIPLEEGESANATLSLNGLYFVTVTSDFNYLNKFAIENGTEIAKTAQFPLNFQTGPGHYQLEIHPIAEDVFAIHLLESQISPENRDFTTAARQVEIVQVRR